MIQPLIPQAGEQSTAGAFDAIVNHALLSVLYSSENHLRGADYIAACNLQDCAEEALSKTLHAIADDVAKNVIKNRGFELGLNVARIVLPAPLADHSKVIRALLDRYIAEEREARS